MLPSPSFSATARARSSMAADRSIPVASPAAAARAAARVVTPHPQPTSSTWSRPEIPPAANRCASSGASTASCRSWYSTQCLDSAVFQYFASSTFAMSSSTPHPRLEAGWPGHFCRARGKRHMGDDFTWMDATEQAELVRKGEVTPTELVEGAITRIEKLNPQLNAVIHRLDDKATAAAADPALPEGPFRGVPFLVKDGVCHTAGDPFHCGMQVLKDIDWHEDADTWLAERFRAAGFVFVGKTNLPELASSVTTEPLAYGATHNPWNLDYSPGGSSGGAAAAVAVGVVAVAHGNDMGGSIRVPASACGLVGLKPTRARTTLGPDFGEFWGPLTHEHVLTRSVRDTAAVLDATAGPGPGDPYTAPAPARRYRDDVGVPPGRLRIGIRTMRIDGAESHPDCVSAVDASAQL